MVERTWFREYLQLIQDQSREALLLERSTPLSSGDFAAQNVENTGSLFTGYTV